MMTDTASRRTFLATAASYGRILGANDRPRIGVIGTGGRGQSLMKELLKLGGTEFVAICDVYDVRRAEAAKIAGPQAEQYADHRQVIARKDIDAVIVATPDHWHAPIAVEALRAGKDVYVEKPMCHNPKDGQAMVKAVRETGRVLQAGTQGRGLPQFVAAKEKYIDTGIIGKVGIARAWYNSNQGYLKTPPPGMETKPAGLDWDRWLGRGPKVPWNPDIYFSPYKWLHYDGGMIMGIAIHVLDSVHHWLNLKNPRAVSAGGGNYFYKNDRDTPDVITIILDYPQEVTATFEAECLTAPGVKTSAGVMLRGTGGTLWAERYVQEVGYEYVPNAKFSKEPAFKGPGTGAAATNILKNWLECLKSRQTPVANVEAAYYSSTACYMALQAFRTQSRVPWRREWDI
jgi:predicted dehydrogenase